MIYGTETGDQEASVDHMHMLKPDGTEVPAPDHADPHGWTVLYLTPACGHLHRVLGWVGTMHRAALLSATAAALCHPYLRVIPVPAPASDMPAESCGVITYCPDEIRERVARGEKVTVEDMAAAGVEWAEMRDEVMPPPIMAASRLLELLEAKGVDVLTLLVEAGGAHAGQRALIEAGGEDVFKLLMAEFPMEDPWDHE